MTTLTRKLKYLTVEQQVAILQQRALEIEADYFASVNEHALAVKLGLEDVQANTENKATGLAEALDHIEAQIADLEGVAATPAPRKRKS